MRGSGKTLCYIPVIVSSTLHFATISSQKFQYFFEVYSACRHLKPGPSVWERLPASVPLKLHFGSVAAKSFAISNGLRVEM
jgi:hypothetical protein